MRIDALSKKEIRGAWVLVRVRSDYIPPVLSTGIGPGYTVGRVGAPYFCPIPNPPLCVLLISS